MTKRKQRHRPAGSEMVYEDEHYSAVVLDVPLLPDPVIRVYSKPYHDFMFNALHAGLHFDCNRCNHAHLLHWYHYNRVVQEDAPPYDVLCVQGDIFLMRAGEPFPADWLKAYRIYTITDDVIALIAAIALFLNNQRGHVGWLALQNGKDDI